jgi:flagellar hook-basal body complex protein FliE
MNSIGTLQSAAQMGKGLSSSLEKDTPEIGFKDKFAEVLSDINQLQLQSGEMSEKFASGEIEDVHDVMIAAEKASVGLELTIEVRNKLVEAYREIMRTQM